MSRLCLVGKYLGVGYLLLALAVLGNGIAKTISFTTAYLQHWADVEADPLMLIPFVTFVPLFFSA
jgi:hypothetical protein